MFLDTARVYPLLITIKTLNRYSVLMNSQARIILQKVLGADVIENLSDEVDLIESGLLDSLLAFQLIAEIQEEFQVDLLSESVTLDFIRTISKLNQWIDAQSL